MSGHGHVSSGGGVDGCKGVGELCGQDLFGRQNLLKKLKNVLRACNYTYVNTPSCHPTPEGVGRLLEPSV